MKVKKIDMPSPTPLQRGGDKQQKVSFFRFQLLNKNPVRAIKKGGLNGQDFEWKISHYLRNRVRGSFRNEHIITRLDKKQIVAKTHHAFSLQDINTLGMIRVEMLFYSLLNPDCKTSLQGITIEFHDMNIFVINFRGKRREVLKMLSRTYNGHEQEHQQGESGKGVRHRLKSGT